MSLWVGAEFMGRCDLGAESAGSSLLWVGWRARWDSIHYKGSACSGTLGRISAGILMAPRRLGASHLDLVCEWRFATRSRAVQRKWCQRVRLGQEVQCQGRNREPTLGLTAALACPTQAATTAQVNSIAAWSARPARVFSANTGPRRHHTSRSECEPTT